MFSLLGTIIFFLITITILISFHELGHFLVAKWFGVKVLRFSIGFGKPLYRHVWRDGSDFVIAALPLGGYVKLLDEAEGEVAEKDLPHAFNRQPLSTRAAVVCAGPLFNILFALLAYWLIFIIGVPGVAPVIGEVIPNSIANSAGLKPLDEIIALGNQKTKSWNDVNIVLIGQMGNKRNLPITVKGADGSISLHQLNLQTWQLNAARPKPLTSLGIVAYQPLLPPVINKVLDDSPAAKAGLQVGDKVTQINGQKVTDWQQMRKLVNQYPNQKIIIEVQRQNKLMQIPIVAKSDQQDGVVTSYLGIESQKQKYPQQYLRTEQYSFLGAIIPAIAKTWLMIKLTFGILAKMFVGKISLNSISGPVGIAQGAGISASFGFTYFLDFLAALSVSLGVLNILPIPVLDGGHLLYYLLEFIRGKPLSLQAREFGMRIGIFLVLILLFLALFNDFRRILS